MFSSIELLAKSRSSDRAYVFHPYRVPVLELDIVVCVGFHFSETCFFFIGFKWLRRKLAPRQKRLDLDESFPMVLLKPQDYGISSLP